MCKKCEETVGSKTGSEKEAFIKPSNVKSVPYQLCPKCRGEGKVYKCDIGEQLTIDSGFIPCDVCNGYKIIPQCIINE